MDSGANSLPSPSCADGTKRRVCYSYDPDISYADYGRGHHMVPHRVSLTHGLVASYGLLPEMQRLRTRPATNKELLQFHDAGYLDVLAKTTPASYRSGGQSFRTKAAQCGIGYVDGGNDNPVIDDVLGYCARYSGGSLAAACALCSRTSDIAINWSGGMHHACKEKAGGFCYVNDIVLAIKQLLVSFDRVLYVDIDAHHGDGVQNAFLDKNRVMTVSFHQYGVDFFPGTGRIDEVGEGEGLYCSLNVPLKEGMDDQGYQGLFRPIVGKAMEVFQPEAIVLQCGADSLAGDKLGGLNLSVRGHAECVKFLRSFNRPLLLLGGGGYTINHVACCWCYETAVAVAKEDDIHDTIPFHGYENYYQDQGFKLHYPTARSTPNRNTEKDTADIKRRAFEHLSALKGPPSVQFQEPPEPVRVVDDNALYDRDHWEEDPMERLHRLCGEKDVARFYSLLTKKHGV